MQDLIERLEAAECGSRELDVMMALSADKAERVIGEWRYNEAGRAREVEPFTTSLDAALALAERVLPGWGWQITRDDCIGSYYAWVGRDFYLDGPNPKTHPRGVHDAPALALCIAILKATTASAENR